MTNILELLKNEKVEWKKLGEVANIQRGRVISKKYLEEHRGEFPVYSSQTKNDGIIGKIDTYDFDGEYITWTTDGAYAGTVFYRYGKFSITNICGLIKPKDNLIIKYLCYWLQIEAKKHVTGGSGNPKLMSNVVANIPIPIPSPETQEKIAKILDKFTNYVTELQSELQSRTKQYTYYRDKLLSEEYLTKVTKEMEGDRKVKTLRLEEVCEFKRGKRLVKSELQEEGEFPVYQNSIIPLGYYHEKNFERDNTFIISAGAAGEIVYSDREFWAADDVYVLKTKENITSKYLYYLLLSKQYIIKSKVRKASIPRLSKDDIEKILVDIPPLSLQNKIVKVLDEFQVLLADTKGLLPAEIEERQKQYEYYREKLLTFDAISDRFDSIRFITSLYYNILQEAANIVEVDIEDKIEWKNLEDVFYTKNGYTPSKKIKEFWDNGSVPWFRMEDIRTNGSILYDSLLYVTESAVKNGVLFKEDSIILATSATIGEHALIKVPFLSNQRFTCFTRKREEELNIKFMYYYFYILDEWCKTNVSIGSFPSIDVSKLLLKKIPIPPLHVQQHVVSILDKFDTLVNDIKEGLPKEIEQRRQQYEYWRECLLNFPR